MASDDKPTLAKVRTFAQDAERVQHTSTDHDKKTKDQEEKPSLGRTGDKKTNQTDTHTTKTGVDLKNRSVAPTPKDFKKEKTDETHIADRPHTAEPRTKIPPPPPKDSASAGGPPEPKDHPPFHTLHRSSTKVDGPAPSAEKQEALQQSSAAIHAAPDSILDTEKATVLEVKRDAAENATIIKDTKRHHKGFLRALYESITQDLSSVKKSLTPKPKVVLTVSSPETRADVVSQAASRTGVSMVANEGVADRIRQRHLLGEETDEIAGSTTNIEPAFLPELPAHEDNGSTVRVQAVEVTPRRTFRTPESVSDSQLPSEVAAPQPATDTPDPHSTATKKEEVTAATTKPTTTKSKASPASAGTEPVIETSQPKAKTDDVPSPTKSDTPQSTHPVTTDETTTSDLAAQPTETTATDEPSTAPTTARPEPTKPDVTPSEAPRSSPVPADPPAQATPVSARPPTAVQFGESQTEEEVVLEQATERYQTNILVVQVISVVLLTVLVIYSAAVLIPNLLPREAAAPSVETVIGTQSVAVVLHERPSTDERWSVVRELLQTHRNEVLQITPQEMVDDAWQTADAGTVFRSLNFTPPASLQSIATAVYLGGYRGPDNPYILIKVSNRNEALGALLTWEVNLANELLPWITTTNDGRFRDVVNGGHDLRVFMGEDNTPQLTYGLTNNAILITTTPSVWNALVPYLR